MKPIVLFGAGKIAEVLLYFFRNHSDRQVAACTTDKEYMPENSWNGLPTVPFENLKNTYPPDQFDLFVALGYQDLNHLRSRKCEEARAMGYILPSYIHPESGLPKDCEYGDNCFIMNNVMIHPRVRMGDNVFVWSGAMIGHHSSIGHNCWLTSCCNISGLVTLGKNCFMAVNSTIAHSVKVGDDCFIGANALVAKCTKDKEVYLADPSKTFRLNSKQFLRMSKFANT
jgi:sugar O-acyltransferase (sialic acid O-acetyltransferase NeuD family)